MMKSLAVLGFVAVCGSMIVGQGAAAARFEVASIRQAPTLREASRNTGTAPAAPSIRVTPSRVDLIHILLRSLVPMAFRVNTARVEWPQWMRNLSVSDQPRFDIQATIPPGIERARVPDMLRGLLVERFAIVARTELRPLKVYGLVVANGGHKMRKVEAVNDLERKFPVGASERVSSDDTITQFTHESLIRENNEVRVIEFDRETQRTVTSQSLFMEKRNRDKGTRDIDAERITMAELAQALGRPNEIPIVDRTGLDGVYQLRVTIPDDTFAFVSSRSSIITDRSGNLIDRSRNVASGLSIFKAVETLGLRLEEQVVPFEYLVVQEIRRVPTEN